MISIKGSVLRTRLALVAELVGWYRRALAMCGARAPRVVEEECRAKGGSVCRYRLRWS